MEELSSMYFDKYKDHQDAKIDPLLFWEYDMSRFDYQQMRNVVVQRVVERGWTDDFYATLNLYGLEEFKAILKSLPYLNDKDMYFVSNIFEIPLSELKCYERKRSRPLHWNS